MKYKCDDPVCGAIFTKEEVVLKPATTNIQILGVGMVGADKAGRFIRVPGQFREGDQVLHCPKCGRLHLFGFDVAEEPVVQNVN